MAEFTVLVTEGSRPIGIHDFFLKSLVDKSLTLLEFSIVFGHRISVP
jgi:hypothetical protein